MLFSAENPMFQSQENQRWTALIHSWFSLGLQPGPLQRSPFLPSQFHTLYKAVPPLSTTDTWKIINCRCSWGGQAAMIYFPKLSERIPQWVKIHCFGLTKLLSEMLLYLTSVFSILQKFANFWDFSVLNSADSEKIRADQLWNSAEKRQN